LLFYCFAQIIIHKKSKVLKITNRMKRINFLLISSFFASFLSLFVISCSNNATTDTVDNNTTVKADSSVTDTIAAGTRTIKKKIAAESYYYKNLITVENGMITSKLKDLANLADKKVNLVVLYEADAPWAQIFNSGAFEITGDDQLNTLMEYYGLQIIQQFAIDASNEGIVMEPISLLENPIETAREVSTVEHVLMVHIKEIPTAKNKVTTDTEK
jgi:hypothetical protein